HTVFAQLTDIFAGQAETDDSQAWSAFEASERGRARSLRYALNQETGDASSTYKAPPTAKYQRLLGEVAAVAAPNPPGSVLVDQIDQLALRASSSAALSFDREQLHRTLGQLNSTLIEYASGSTGMLAFVVGGGRVKVVHLGDSQEIARATAELRDRLRDPETAPSEVRAAARTLARLIWWPLTPYIPTGRIVVVPDDALHTVPLAVLPWSQDPSQQLVLQHAETTVVPSALFLLHVTAAASTHSPTPRMALI